jgi:carboxylesterase
MKMKGSEQIFIDKNSRIGVLMLHGFSSTPRQFKELSAYLVEKGFTVFAPLIAGHGTTPKDLMESSPEDWTESVKKAYLELKSKSEKVFIIGNSFGSNLALWLIKEFNNEQTGIITLGAPIFLRFHNLIKFRLFTYGRFKKYYHKPLRIYKADYTDLIDEISYNAIPIKSLNELIKFLEKETTCNLNKIKIPILIANSEIDPVIKPKSANYIFKNIGSSKKEIFWFNSDKHGTLEKEGGCEGLFPKIYNFISEIEKL